MCLRRADSRTFAVWKKHQKKTVTVWKCLHRQGRGIEAPYREDTAYRLGVPMKARTPLRKGQRVPPSLYGEVVHAYLDGTTACYCAGMYPEKSAVVKLRVPLADVVAVSAGLTEVGLTKLTVTRYAWKRRLTYQQFYRKLYKRRR